MNMRDPGEKGQNFKAVILATKVFMQIVTGSLMVLFLTFCVTEFGQKTNLKHLHMDIFEAFGRYESNFRTD